jgi:hypothetical protein
MRVKTRQYVRFQLPPCVPDDVKADDILWYPDRTERLLSKALVRQRLFEQELRERELLEQRQWLTAATQRMAAVALELDKTDRRIKLQESRGPGASFQVHSFCPQAPKGMHRKTKVAIATGHRSIARPIRCLL